MRTIRRHANGTATVSVVVKARPWSAVVADMIEGFVAVNKVRGNEGGAASAEVLRDHLWSAIEQIDLTDEPQPTAPLRVLEDAA